MISINNFVLSVFLYKPTHKQRHLHSLTGNGHINVLMPATN